MTNLDSIFKSRDITLPTKVHLVKAMVFPVVTYLERRDPFTVFGKESPALPSHFKRRRSPQEGERNSRVGSRT